MGAAHSTTDTSSALRPTSAVEAAQELVLNAEAEAKRHEMDRQDRQMLLEEEAKRRQMLLEEEARRRQMLLGEEARRRQMLLEEEARRLEMEAKRRQMLHEEDANRQRALRFRAVVGVSALGLVGLGLYVYRTYSNAVRISRCKRALRSGLQQFASRRVPSDITRPSAERLMLNAPHMYCVFGASGSGKTTMLERVARQAALDNRPGIFLRMRGDSTATVNPMTVFSDIAKAIDFPVPATFAEVAASTALTLASASQAADNKTLGLIRSVFESILPRPRVADMANVLLSAVEELAHEALQRGGKVPVVIFDEVAELVRSDRLRNAGGEGFFDIIASAGVWLNEGSHIPVTWVLSSSAIMWHKRLPSLTGAGRSSYIFISEASPSEIEQMIVTELGSRRSEFTAEDFIYVCERFGLRVRYWHRVLKIIASGTSVEGAVNSLEKHLEHLVDQKAKLLLVDEQVCKFLKHLMDQPAMKISEHSAGQSFGNISGETYQQLCEAYVLTWYENELMFHSRFAYRWVCKRLNVPVVPFNSKH
jgi:hypothetical protein